MFENSFVKQVENFVKKGGEPAAALRSQRFVRRRLVVLTAYSELFLSSGSVGRLLHPTAQRPSAPLSGERGL